MPSKQKDRLKEQAISVNLLCSLFALQDTDGACFGIYNHRAHNRQVFLLFIH